MTKFSAAQTRMIDSVKKSMDAGLKGFAVQANRGGVKTATVLIEAGVLKDVTDRAKDFTMWVSL